MLEEVRFVWDVHKDKDNCLLTFGKENCSHNLGTDILVNKELKTVFNMLLIIGCHV